MSSSASCPPIARWSPQRVAARADCTDTLSRPHQRLAHACRAEARRSAGAVRDRCRAKRLTNVILSWFQRPPTSHARTTRRAWMLLASSGYRSRLRPSARRRTAPSSPSAPVWGLPSRRRGDLGQPKWGRCKWGRRISPTFSGFFRIFLFLIFFPDFLFRFFPEFYVFFVCFPDLFFIFHFS